MASVGIDFQMWNTEFCMFHVWQSVQIFLNEIQNHVHFTDDNWNNDFSAILTCDSVYFIYENLN